MANTLEELGQAVKKAHPGQFDDQEDRAVGSAVKQAYPDQFSDVTDHASFGQRFGENIPHPVDMLRSVVSAMDKHGQLAAQEWKQGNHIKAAIHALTAMNPAMALGADQAESTLQHLSAASQAQQSAAPGAPISQDAIQETLKAVPMIGQSAAGIQQDIHEGNPEGVAGSVGGIATTLLAPKVIPKVASGVSEGLSNAGKEIINKYQTEVAKPGGKNIVHGGITLAAAPVLYGMGHTIAGPLAFLRGSTQLLEGLGQAAREGGGELPSTPGKVAPELPKGAPMPFQEAVTNRATSPTANPNQPASNQGLDPKLLDQTAKNLGAKDFASITNDNIRKVVINGVRQRMMDEGRLPSPITGGGAEEYQQQLNEGPGLRTPAATKPESTDLPRYHVVDKYGRIINASNDINEARKMGSAALTAENIRDSVTNDIHPIGYTELPKGNSSMFNTTPVSVGDQEALFNEPGGHPVYGMPRTPVLKPSGEPSGALKAAAYHEPTQTQLIEFQNGKTLIHKGLPPEIHNEMMTSESPGSVYNKKIKPNYLTQESVMRPRTAAEQHAPPTNTPSEQMRPQQVDPMEKILHDSLDAEKLRQYTLDQIKKKGWNTQEHQVQIQQLIRDAAHENNIARASQGIAPTTQEAINNVIKGFQE